MTRIIFRKFDDQEVIAFFPDQKNDYNGFIMSYMHTGQHSEADYQGLLTCTKLATEKEYLPLWGELIRIGYKNIKVIKKWKRS